MILVVDDNIETCHLLLRVLKLVKAKGHCEDSGKHAVAWLKSNAPPDLVILDVNMPDISGIEVLKIIKADPELRAIPVVMHTALPAADIVQMATGFGADGVLLKGRYRLTDVMDVVNTFTRPGQDSH